MYLFKTTINKIKKIEDCILIKKGNRYAGFIFKC